MFIQCATKYTNHILNFMEVVNTVYNKLEKKYFKIHTVKKGRSIHKQMGYFINVAFLFVIVQQYCFLKHQSSG